MRRFLIGCFKLFLNIIYAPIKLFPVGKKIVFISRQGHEPGLDFCMISDKLEKEYPDYKLIMLCSKMPSSILALHRYFWHMCKQLWHLTTSKVCVLDSYCIAVSVLKLRKSLKVLQIWHALGAFKKFGWSAVDMPEGSSREIAEQMNMHRGYTAVICSGRDCAEPFAEAFNTDKSKVLPIGLPRMDYLVDEEISAQNRRQIFSRYPSLGNGKKNILYAPTFRKSKRIDYNMDNACKAVSLAIDKSRFNLIIKTHSGAERIITQNGEETGHDFLGLQFFSVADYVISDYSSIIYEAAIAQKPIYLYAFDADEYLSTRGFYLDFWRDIPAVISKDIKDIAAAINKNDQIEQDKVKAFTDKYLTNPDGKITDRLCDLIILLANN